MKDETKEVPGNHFFFTPFSCSDEHWGGDSYGVRDLERAYWNPREAT